MYEATRQGGVFLTMVYAGLLCGVGYDIVRALRRLLKTNRIVTGVLDLLFWLGAAALCAFFLMRITHEPLRLYALLGCASGMLLYLAGVSEVLYAILRPVIQAVRRLFTKLRGKRQKNMKKQDFS